MLKKLLLQLLDFFYPMVKKMLPFEIYAYLAVGALNTALNIGLFTLLFLHLKNSLLAVEIATGIAFIITVCSGFWLNKHLAFTTSSKEKKDTKKQFGKYALVALQGQLNAYLLTKGMIVWLSLSPSYSYFLTAVIMLTINYFLQKYFTFRSRQKMI